MKLKKLFRSKDKGSSGDRNRNDPSLPVHSLPTQSALPSDEMIARRPIVVNHPHSRQMQPSFVNDNHNHYSTTMTILTVSSGVRSSSGLHVIDVPYRSKKAYDEAEIQNMLDSTGVATAILRRVSQAELYECRLCESCSAISSDFFVNGKDSPYLLKPRITDLVDSSNTGCAFCGITQEYISTTESIAQDDEREVWLVAQKLVINAGFEVGIALGRPIPHISLMSRIRFCVEDIDEAGNALIGPQGYRAHQHITARNDSQRTFDIANAWLQECKRMHTKCNRSWLSAKLPLRLVYVGAVYGSKVQEAKLILTEGLEITDTPYLCLSYCWGKQLDTQAVLTTTVNLRQRMVQIDPEEMSKTLQDAMVITRGLGFRYVWIDALCICQDSLQDWQNESAQMGVIYENAKCVIAASDARDTLEGCFRTRGPELTNRITVKYNAKTRRLITVAPPRKGLGAIDPLQTRGWCFQEHILTPRIIKFTGGELLWECEQAKAKESDSWPDVAFNTAMSFNEPVDGYKPWLTFVETYSRRELIKETDRLPAISGLVSELILKRPHPTGKPQHPEGSVYLAGIFKDSLQGSLFWTKDYNYPTSLKRSATYIAPSWSWVSVSSPIAFEKGIRSNSSVLGDRRPGDDSWSNRAKWTPLLLDAFVTLAGLDPYGQVKFGWISLQGVLKGVRNGGSTAEGPLSPPRIFAYQFAQNDDTPSQHLLASTCHAMKDPKTDELRGRVYLDNESDAREPFLYCLRWEKYFSERFGIYCFTYIVLCELPGFMPRGF